MVFSYKVVALADRYIVATTAANTDSSSEQHAHSMTSSPSLTCSVKIRLSITILLENLNRHQFQSLFICYAPLQMSNVCFGIIHFVMCYMKKHHFHDWLDEDLCLSGKYSNSSRWGNSVIVGCLVSSFCICFTSSQIKTIFLYTVIFRN